MVFHIPPAQVEKFNSTNNANPGLKDKIDKNGNNLAREMNQTTSR
jgi:hypothetical protein